MKRLFLLLLLPLLVVAAERVTPADTITVDGNVMDSVIYGERLYVGTDAGTLEIFDWTQKSCLTKLTYPKIHDFMGDLMSPKVFGVDFDPHSGALVVQLQAEGGERELLYYPKGPESTPIRLITADRHLAMREVRFVDSQRILIATMGNEMILYDLKKRKELWHNQISESVFSDYSLDETHKHVASSCESGELFVIDVATGEILQHYFDINKDNVFQVDFKNRHVLTAGKDKRAVLYNLPLKSHYIYTAGFFVYACALNRQATLSAFQIDERNDIGIYDNLTHRMLYRLSGQSSTINNIVFIDDKTVITSSDDNHILIWRLP